MIEDSKIIKYGDYTIDAFDSIEANNLCHQSVTSGAFRSYLLVRIICGHFGLEFIFEFDVEWAKARFVYVSRHLAKYR